MNQRFTDEDRGVLNRLIFDPKSEPSFELLKMCLVWPDERPEKISRAGYELLGDLWIVRGFFHRQVALKDWGLEPQYFQSVWSQAVLDVPLWPGFRRAVLSEIDSKYLETALRSVESDENY